MTEPTYYARAAGTRGNRYHIVKSLEAFNSHAWCGADLNDARIIEDEPEWGKIEPPQPGWEHLPNHPPKVCSACAREERKS